jgi:hypothetical protein
MRTVGFATVLGQFRKEVLEIVPRLSWFLQIENRARRYSGLTNKRHGPNLSWPDKFKLAQAIGDVAFALNLVKCWLAVKEFTSQQCQRVEVGPEIYPRDCAENCADRRRT